MYLTPGEGSPNPAMEGRRPIHISSDRDRVADLLAKDRLTQEAGLYERDGGRYRQPPKRGFSTPAEPRHWWDVKTRWSTVAAVGLIAFVLGFLVAELVVQVTGGRV